jgi:hypothetical protein
MKQNTLFSSFNCFSNFDDIRLCYKGNPVAVFKLKTSIKVNELIHAQHFEFQKKPQDKERRVLTSLFSKLED